MTDSFKLENQYQKKSSKKKKTKKRSFIFLVIVFIIVGFMCYYFINNNYDTKKKIDSKPYIYTIKQELNSFQDNIYDEIPTINLVGKKFDELNTAILNNYKEVSAKVEYDYNYEYNQSKNILSLKITYAYYPDEESIYPMRYFETINIDLRDGKILSEDEILHKYHLTKEKVNFYLEAKFKEFYGDLVKKGYYTENQCNYDCFLKNRGISNNYLNGTSYYIENNSLTLFKYFYIYSDYLEENYFKDENYQFIIKK